MASFIIRIRHSKGTTRLQLPDKATTTTIADLKKMIEQELVDKPSPLKQQLTLDGKNSDTALRNHDTLSSLNLRHGDMLYLKIVSSAVLCQSHNATVSHENQQQSSSSASSGPTTSSTTSRNRKRKFDVLATSATSDDDHSNESNHRRKRARLNSDSNRSTQASHSHEATTSTTSTGHRVGHGRSLSSAIATDTSKKTADDKKKLQKKTASKKSPAKNKKKKDEFLMLQSEGETIDEIVDNYMVDPEHNRLSVALTALPSTVQSAYSAQGRIDAILDDKVEITEQLERHHLSSRVKSRGKLHLLVVYQFNRRKRKESVCYYDEQRMQEILTQLIWRSVGDDESQKVRFQESKLSKAAVMQCIKDTKLTFGEMSKRSPPLLWSLFHAFPQRKIEDVVYGMVKEALKTVRQKCKDIDAGNEHP